MRLARDWFSQKPAINFKHPLNMKYKQLLAVIMSLAMAAFVVGCMPGSSSGTKIGVSMPTRALQRWNQDGENMQKKLTEHGYAVELEFADNDAATQISQLDKMIDDGCKVIVVTAVDANSLSEVLDKAQGAGAHVISYDRLIMNSDAVDYYASFDNLTVGTMQGEYIIDKLGLKEGKGPYKMEIVAGSLDDNNAKPFFEGAMDLLRPYIKKGQLIVKSGQTDLKSCATLHWQSYIAKARLNLLLNAYYVNDKLDVVLCANDSTALGVESSLKENGYGSADKPMPVITGQDADKHNVAAIIKGDQSMTVFKDTRILAEQVVKMIDAIVAGKEPETNDIGNYNNGMKVVPSFLIRPQIVDKSNYKAVLLDSGYYTEKEIDDILNAKK